MTWHDPVLNTLWNSHDVPITVHFWRESYEANADGVNGMTHVEIVEEGRTMCGLRPEEIDLFGIGKRDSLSCVTCQTTWTMIVGGAQVTFGDQVPDV